MVKAISIQLSEEEIKTLTRKAEKNLLSLKEQIEDIIRLSVLRSKKKSLSQGPKTDDALVAIFSREKKGKNRRK